MSAPVSWGRAGRARRAGNGAAAPRTQVAYSVSPYASGRTCAPGALSRRARAGRTAGPPRARSARAFALLPILAVLAIGTAGGCHRGHEQSALHPASPEAAGIATLWWVMFAVLGVAFLIVMGLTLFAVSRAPRGKTAPGGAVRFVTISGIVVPGIILVGMLVYSLQTTLSLRRPAEGRLIQVTGFRWWWEIRYPELGIVTANEIYIPAGEPVRLELRAKDVVHSFWVPNLHGKIDMLPETVTRFWIRTDQPGTWRGQCAEFCGRQHALMALHVVALPREEFDRWVEERRRPHPVPAAPGLQRGEEVFFRASCHVCHAIRGSPAEGRLGPDLTHIGSRLTLGAGSVENSREQLAAWIHDPQALKPGNLMPHTPLERDELEALVDFLHSLQ
jgi:cytochrome c oxidase subunit II